jgi:hypothetical protein
MKLMVKKIAYSAIFCLLVLFETVLAETSSTAPVSVQSSSHVGLPESVALVVLGSLLIGGAMVLRRRWAGRREGSQHSKAAGLAE